MPNVSYNGSTYVCAIAIKGEDFIRLLDANYAPIAVFEGISDFSDYTITDGDWESPLEEGACNLVVMRRDGSVSRSGLKCGDIVASSVYTCVLSANSATKWGAISGGYRRSIPVTGLAESDLVLIISSSNDDWLQSKVSLYISPNYLVFDATSLPSADVHVTFSVMKLSAAVALD